MVMIGGASSMVSQKRPLLKNASVTGTSNGLPLSARSTITKLSPSRNCTAATIE